MRADGSLSPNNPFYGLELEDKLQLAQQVVCARDGATAVVEGYISAGGVSNKDNPLLYENIAGLVLAACEVHQTLISGPAVADDILGPNAETFYQKEKLYARILSLAQILRKGRIVTIKPDSPERISEHARRIFDAVAPVLELDESYAKDLEECLYLF